MIINARSVARANAKPGWKAAKFKDGRRACKFMTLTEYMRATGCQ